MPMTSFAVQKSTQGIAVALLLVTALPGSAAASEDIEFVAEHLAEVAMDNRYATLPVWAPVAEAGGPWSFTAQAAYAGTKTGNLDIGGPMFSVAVNRSMGRAWAWTTFAFLDGLRFTGDRDVRPLHTLFSPNTPLSLPELARFDDLDGRMRHYGAGLSVSLSGTSEWLGSYHGVAGLLWERAELRDYRLTYEVLEGPDAGVVGQIDFDTDYAHTTPFVGLEFPRSWTLWSISPHVLATWPYPRHGIVGHITGPGFDLRGNTEEVSEGKHFGDPSLTLGIDVTYMPAHFSIDVGTIVSQRFLEPLIHKGIEANWLVSCQWRF